MVNGQFGSEIFKHKIFVYKIKSEILAQKELTFERKTHTYLCFNYSRKFSLVLAD